MKISLSETAQLLKSKDNILLLAHKHPDGDTLGSSYALCRALTGQGKKANVICDDEIPKVLRFLANGVEPLLFEPEFIIAIDTADIKMLGDKLRTLYASKINLCIDHHISNTLYAEKTMLDDTAAATAEIIFRLLKEMRTDITPSIADCLYTGVSTDTGCFRYSNITSETLRIAAELIDLGADYARLNKELFETKSKSFAALERAALNSIEIHFGGLCAVLAVTKEMFLQSGSNDEEFDRISALPRQIEDVLVGAAIREQKNGTYKVSVRTNPPMNAAEICAGLGGGGHVNAAGCTLEGTLDEAKEKLLKAIEAALISEKKLIVG
jgi:phosphoesterase RecJ-like protein